MPGDAYRHGAVVPGTELRQWGLRPNDAYLFGVLAWSGDKAPRSGYCQFVGIGLLRRQPLVGVRSNFLEVAGLFTQLLELLRANLAKSPTRLSNPLCLALSTLSGSTIEISEFRCCVMAIGEYLPRPTRWTHRLVPTRLASP